MIREVWCGAFALACLMPCFCKLPHQGDFGLDYWRNADHTFMIRGVGVGAEALLKYGVVSLIPLALLTAAVRNASLTRLQV